MRRSAYLKQLRSDLERWVADGLVARDKVEAILERAGPEVRTRSLAFILSFLGVILLGVAAMVFVGANWQAWPRLVKLGLLMAALWLIYGAAIVLLRRAQPLYAQAAILFGVAMYGANIMLIGQIYHINAGWPGGIMLWGLGALAAGFIIPSRAAAAFAMVLLTIWTVGETTDGPWLVHWPFLPALALGFAFAYWQRWGAMMHLGLLAFAVWSGATALSVAEALDPPAAYVVLALLALALVVWLSGEILEGTGQLFGGIAAGYGLLGVAGMFFLTQMLDEGGSEAASVRLVAAAGAVVPVLAFALVARLRGAIRSLDLLAALAIAVATASTLWLPEKASLVQSYLYAGLYLLFVVWLIAHGLAKPSALAVNLGFVAFAAEVLYLYFAIFGTMLHQSLFLALGGLIFLAAAFGLERMRRRLITTTRPRTP